MQPADHRSMSKQSAVCRPDARGRTSAMQAERFTEQAVAEVLQLLVYWTMGIALPSGIFAVAFFLPHSRCCCSRQPDLASHIALPALTELLLN